MFTRKIESSHSFIVLLNFILTMHSKKTRFKHTKDDPTQECDLKSKIDRWAIDSPIWKTKTHALLGFCIALTQREQWERANRQEHKSQLWSRTNRNYKL